MHVNKKDTHSCSHTFLIVLIAVLTFGLISESRAQEQFDKAEITNKLAQSFLQYYVFPEVGKEIHDALKDELSSGKYDDLDDPKKFAAALQSTIKQITTDGHLRVISDTNRVAAIQKGKPGGVPSLPENKGFQDIEIKEGNIGYVNLTAFLNIGIARNEAKATMDKLIQTNAVIIDLRNNGGGDPSMVAFLANYFLEDKPVHLNTLYFRPNDQTIELWTKPEESSFHNTEIPLYILTSSRTGSAAEGFSYHLKHLKRATIVGETSAGAANPGGFVQLGGSFLAFISTGQVTNPVTQGNWEGTGVIPHVKTTADNALEKALGLARKELGSK